MKTKTSSIMLVIATTLFTSIAQLSYKFGIDKLSLSFPEFILNPYFLYILFGLFLYGIGAAMLIIALKGGEVTILYPIIATSYIWVSMLSVLFLNEIMNWLKWIGVVVIIIGIITIAFSSKDEELVELTSEVI